MCEDDMYDSGIFDGDCCPADLWEKKHYGTAVPFFLTYMLLSNFILMNVVVGFVLESYVTQVANTERGLTMQDFEDFREAWYQFDVAHTGFLHVSMLSRFMLSLRDKPFKTLQAAEHDRTAPGLGEFRESDLVLMSNLHALALPGDVLQVFHVFIAL